MSISSEITRIQNKRDLSFIEVENKGVTVPAGSTIDDLPGLIAQIEQGSGSGSGGIIYQDLDGYLNLSEDEANVISIVDTLDTAGGTVRTITGAVESGGGYTANDWLDYSKPTGAIVSDATLGSTGCQAFYKHTGITSVHLTSAEHIPTYFCAEASSLETFVGRVLTECQTATFLYCTNLIAIDILGGGTVGVDFIRFASKCDTIILRNSSLTSLTNYNVFRGSRYASGGAGGTIYIPKSLYDHLGDGTSLDYKAATNWSTVEGYGTITWAQIEGSIYETQYADGTPIT